MVDLLMKVLIVISFCLLLGCSSDTVHVDNELQSFYEEFVNEARLRGISVDVGQVEGHIEFLRQSGVVGQCQRNTDDDNVIIIDKLYWKDITPLEKEMVVFHELGHCVLNRGHINDVNKEDFCISIMGDGVSCTSNYTEETREYYLDELFEN